MRPPPASARGYVSVMELEPRTQPPRAPLTDDDRQAAADLLQDAAGDGRLTLEQFSDRVGAVWAADRHEQLDAAVAGLAAPPVVGGSASTVSTVVAVLSEQRRDGRWRLPARLAAYAIMGTVRLDLRSVVCGEDVVEIRARVLMGALEVDVPDGVEVELDGFDLLGSRTLRLAPVPRVPGTPLIRVHAHTVLSDVKVRSEGTRKGIGRRRQLAGQDVPALPGAFPSASGGGPLRPGFSPPTLGQPPTPPTPMPTAPPTPHPPTLPAP